MELGRARAWASQLCCRPFLQGVYVLMSGLDYERLVLSAGPLGIMQASDRTGSAAVLSMRLAVTALLPCYPAAPLPQPAACCSPAAARCLPHTLALRLMLPACRPAVQACLDTVLPYCHERTQFGQRIGEFQVCRGRRVNVNTARALLRQPLLVDDVRV